MRISMILAIGLVLLNGFAVAFTASGAAEDWGVDPDVGGDEHVDRANESAAGVQPGQATGGTLFALFTTVASTVEGIFELVFAGPLMLGNLGIPGWILTFLFAPIYLIVGGDLIYVLSGRSVT